MKLFKITLLFSLISLISFGQTPAVGDLQQEIPTDPNVRIGKLENGITYYIKHNPKSVDKAELRLVINAGSVLEEEHQQGLAHFLEHMAFNGTRNFEKNELIDYLENLGVSFGADLNAHTSFDETVYKLSLPTDEETFNTGMQILKDWADGITLSESEIDLERGVVAEEMRGGRHVGRRMFEAYVPVITNNSRYSKRFPIGTEDVILNSDYDAIRDFYNDWYRPDLMAVIIVGDVEIEETEEKIRNVFGEVAPKENARERVEYGIPDNEETTVAVVTDEEATDVQLQLYYKRDSETPETLADYREMLVNRLYAGMLTNRMVEKIETGDAPYLRGGVFIGTFLADKDSYYLSGQLKEDKVEEGIVSLLDEHERARRMGFTQGELERYKKSVLSSADLARKEEGKRNSRFYVEEYIDHFMDQEPIPGAEFTYEFYEEQLPTISLEEVNAVPEKWVREDNISIVLAGPEKEGLDLPDEKELLTLLENSTERELEPYEDTYVARPLMETEPTPGSIVDSEYEEEVNTTILELSNGIKVILKPTTFQNDIVNMRAFRDGGSSLAPDEIYVSARHASNIVGTGGLNGLSPSELRKLNAGKTVGVRPIINFYEELLTGSSSTEDLETMFQMTYLYFTAPNKDEQSFTAYKQRLVENSKNPEANPSRYFYNDIARVMSQDHLRASPITSETYEKELDLDTAFNFYKERFSSADNFTFVFVGNFEVEELKTLLEKYIASLPAKKGKEDEWRDIGLRHPKGVIKKEYKRGKEDKAQVVLHFTGEIDFDLEKKQLLSALASVLKLRLYDELREKRGGVYGVRVQGYATDAPYEWYRLGLEFSSDPANVEELIKASLDEISMVKEEGVTEEEMNKVKEALKLNAKEGLTYNSYWAGKFKQVVEYNQDFEDILNYEEAIDKLTAKKLQKAAKKYFNPNNFAQFVLLPEEK